MSLCVISALSDTGLEAILLEAVVHMLKFIEGVMWLPKRLRVLFVLLVPLVLALQTAAHNPDTSYTQITLSAKQIEFKFAFDITTLLTLADLDQDQDRVVTRENCSDRTFRF